MKKNYTLKPGRAMRYSTQKSTCKKNVDPGKSIQGSAALIAMEIVSGVEVWTAFERKGMFQTPASSPTITNVAPEDACSKSISQFRVPFI